MSRQCLRDGTKALILWGAWMKMWNLHLWKIESVVKTYGNYKRYVLKIRN